MLAPLAKVFEGSQPDVDRNAPIRIEIVALAIADMEFQESLFVELPKRPDELVVGEVGGDLIRTLGHDQDRHRLHPA